MGPLGLCILALSRVEQTLDFWFILCQGREFQSYDIALQSYFQKSIEIFRYME